VKPGPAGKSGQKASTRKSGSAAGPGRKGTPSPQKGVKRRVKFRGPDGQAWSGVGRKPVWVVEALAAGRSLEEFAAE
jgi:DNA-binding protein H-NS